LSAWNKSLYEEIERACGRIIGMSGDCAKVETTQTEYVLKGRTIKVITQKGEFPFWIGINGPRLFFIAYVNEDHQERVQDVFRFCFGGAEKVGWKFNCEGIEGGTSIWATCMTDRERPLVAGSNSDEAVLTEEGLFWATDVAMMAQSWVRTCERENIQRHRLDPAPL